MKTQGFIAPAPWYLPFPGLAQFWLALDENPVTLFILSIESMMAIFTDLVFLVRFPFSRVDAQFQVVFFPRMQGRSAAIWGHLRVCSVWVQCRFVGFIVVLVSSHVFAQASHRSPTV